MNLEIIRTQTTWNDAAGSINSNYAKIADAIAQLKANGGGGGGGADIDLTDYATKLWVEANYAPLTSVQGFENRIGGLEGAVPQLNERVTTVEGKVSSLNETVSTGENNLLDRVNVIEEEYATKTYVDNAIDGIDLSPYLKTEDAKETYATKDFVNNKLINYATIVSVTAIQNTLTGQIGAVNASVEQLAATKLDSSYFTQTNIKSTLGISDWALAATKPSYTAAEVGALGVNGTAQSALKMTPEYLTDLNNATPWRFFDMRSGYGSTDGNKPNVAWVSGITGTVAGSSVYRWQLAGTTGNARPYFRQETNGTWGNWQRLAFTTDLPTKLSHLTDDVVAGNYLPLSGGTIRGSINLGKHDLNVSDDTSTYRAMRLYPDYGFYIGNGTSGNYDTLLWGKNIQFVSNGLTRMYVQSDGKVGIGNTSPAERLDVSGNIKASGNINATSITINGVTITASNGTITVNGNVFATGDITGGV